MSSRRDCQSQHISLIQVVLELFGTGSSRLLRQRKTQRHRQTLHFSLPSLLELYGEYRILISIFVVSAFKAIVALNELIWLVIRAVNQQT